MDEKNIAAIERVLRKFSSARLGYLYGSSLERRDFRDVDIAIGLSSKKKVRDTLKLRLQITAALGKEFPWEFDVHILREMPLSVQHRIISTGRCVLRRSDIERTRYEASLLNEFLDFKPAHDWLIAQSLRRAAAA